jgi:class 3 adenylate cyclase
MFCDLVGSTALSSRLDPEDLRRGHSHLPACVITTIQQFDGFIARMAARTRSDGRSHFVLRLVSS